MEGIAVVNIPSIHGGSNLWGEPKKSDKDLADQKPQEVVLDHNDLKFSSQGRIISPITSAYICYKISYYKAGFPNLVPEGPQTVHVLAPSQFLARQSTFGREQKCGLSGSCQGPGWGENLYKVYTAFLQISIIYIPSLPIQLSLMLYNNLLNILASVHLS